MNSVPSDEELMRDENFQRELSWFRPYWQWMTLAGGINRPIISFSRDGNIRLSKRGWNLWLQNIKNYKNGTEWKEREAALELFAKDLFGEYSEEAKKIISIEYIADHLIEFDSYELLTSHFTLTLTMPTAIKDKRAQELFRKELSETIISN